MNNAIKIATLNLCLGLKNKKDTVKKLILENDIDILCLQETELEPDFPTKLLTLRGYGYESENNVYKSRCGMFVSDKISYIRRNDLEIANNHVIMIDLNDKLKTRIICIFRPFNPSNVTQSNFSMPNWNLLSKIQITTPLSWATSTSTTEKNMTSITAISTTLTHLMKRLCP